MWSFHGFWGSFRADNIYMPLSRSVWPNRVSSLTHQHVDSWAYMERGGSRKWMGRQWIWPCPCMYDFLLLPFPEWNSLVENCWDRFKQTQSFCNICNIIAVVPTFGRNWVKGWSRCKWCFSNGALSHLPIKLWLRTKARGEPKGKLWTELFLKLIHILF